MVKRKEYRFRKGKTVEIQEFHDGNYGAPGKKRIKKKKPTEEQMRLVQTIKLGGAGISCWNISLLGTASGRGPTASRTGHRI